MIVAKRISRAVETLEGDAAFVRRLFPVAGFRHQDPFVLWDHFEVAPGTGFPPHPHRGFEAITFLFSGTMEHADNLGNQSTIGAAGAQRFTAGRGIVHSEMPGQQEAACGIQLWINLARDQKQIDPDYQAANAEELPLAQWTGGFRRSIVGENSPITLHTPVCYFELGLEAGGRYQWTPPEGYSGLIYVADGLMQINESTLKLGDALHLAQAQELNFASNTGSRAMVCFGRPHGEPILQRGTFVD
jgi:redox-sensitive bicupin YhaK (pirin superfamily)